MIQNRIILLVGMLTMMVSILSGQNTLTLDSTTLTKRELVTGVQIPWELKWGPDDHLWFTQRNGMIFRTDPTTGNTTEILDYRSFVKNEDDEGDGSEYGMLGMCFHPDFENIPKVFVVYNYGDNSIMQKLVSFEWNGVSLENEEIVLDGIEGYIYHNGSRILMTMDEKILMSTGDVSIPQYGQKMDTYNGKYLRINLDGSIPEDNPFPDSYIYTFGHRNSQGIAYGPEGKIYISEHGTMVSDELSILEPGGNYGWANVLGYCDTNVEINFCNANDVIEPIYDWSPCVAVSDIEYYNHEAIPEWKGKMMVTVLGGIGFQKFPRISFMSFNEDGSEIVSEEQFFKDFGRIRDVCVNPYTGSIYFATNGPGYPGFGPNQIIEYTNLEYDVISPIVELNSQNLRLSPNPADDQISIESSEELLGANFEIISFQGIVVKKGKVSSNQMNISLSNLEQGQYFIRCSNKAGQLTRTFSIIR